MQKTSTFLLFAIIFTLLLSCKKEDTHQAITNNNPPASGKYLLFDADENFNLGFSAIPSAYTSIYYTNLDGTAVTQITPFEPEYYSYRPSWSPDGTQIIYTHGNRDDSERSLCIIDINGTNLKSITKGNKVDYGAFSPDGKKVVYTKSLTSIAPYPYDIYVANSDGSSEQKLTTFGEDNGAVADIHWASDGKIYFYAGSDNTRTGIYCVNPDGSNLKYIMTDVYLLDISPDAKHILFDLGDGLYTCNIDGSNIKKF